jgi:hypothetical protein
MHNGSVSLVSLSTNDFVGAIGLTTRLYYLGSLSMFVFACFAWALD